MLFNFHRRVAVLALVAGSALVVGCSDTTGSAPQPYPTPTPAGTAPLAASFGAAPAGYTVTDVLTAVPVGTTLTGTISTTAPNGVTPLATKRQAQDIPTSHDTLLYICLTSSKTVTTTQTVAVNVASTISTGPFYLAEQTGATWNTAYAGPYDEVGTLVTFDPTGPAPSITLTAGVQECFALVVAAPGTPTATPSASPSPSPSPTATPVGMTPTPSPSPTVPATATPTAAPTAIPTATPTPTAAPTAIPTATPTPTPTPVPSVSASPSSLDLVGTGSTYAESTTLTQASSAGSISATSGCAPAIVTFSSAAPSGNSVVITATGVGPGSCTETFTGVGGATTTVAITVTTTNVGVSGRKRHS